jgi:cysteine desulfurase
MSRNMYLDANAGIPEEYANAGNTYSQAGQIANEVLLSSSNMIRNMIGSPKDRLLITSGATESTTTAIHMIIHNYPCGMKVILGPNNHPSVPTILESKSVPYTVYNGKKKIEELMDKAKINVFIAPLVDSLTGRITPAKMLIRRMKKHGPTLFLCDATQAVGRYMFNRTSVSADFVSFSAHKFGGPKGIGGLLIGRIPDFELVPLIPGSQQDGLRGGTINVDGVVKMYNALSLSLTDLNKKIKRTKAIIKRAYALLSEKFEIVNVRSMEDLDNTVGNILLIKTIPNAKEIALRLADEGYDVGTGYACSCGESNLIRVSIQMGFSESLEGFCEKIIELADWHDIK